MRRANEDAETAEHRELRQVLGVVSLLALLSLIPGLWVLWPYLEQEHRRMAWWASLCIWSNDAVTLFWFLWYYADHFILGKPLRSFDFPERSHRREFWIFLVSIVFAWGMDFSVTLWLMWDESRAFADANVTDGVVHAVTTTAFKDAVRYEPHCTFVDQQGRQFRAVFAVLKSRTEGFPEGISNETRRCIEQSRVPHPVKISYDPDLPNRNWLTEAGWWNPGANRLYHFSLVVLIFQGIVVFLFGLAAVVSRQGGIPWWCELLKVLPLAIEIGLFFAVGVFHRKCALPAP